MNTFLVRQAYVEYVNMRSIHVTHVKLEVRSLYVRNKKYVMHTLHEALHKLSIGCDVCKRM